MNKQSLYVHSMVVIKNSKQPKEYIAIYQKNIKLVNLVFLSMTKTKKDLLYVVYLAVQKLIKVHKDYRIIQKGLTIIFPIQRQYSLEKLKKKQKFIQHIVVILVFVLSINLKSILFLFDIALKPIYVKADLKSKILNFKIKTINNPILTKERYF